jgi:8-oxo-dGTP pyrophosphatase MutT (NUDIX family)
MLKTLLIGDWPPGRIACRWQASSFHANDEVLALVEQSWSAAKARLGKKLFDGPMCRLEAMQADEHNLNLSFSRISYRVFLGTNLSHADLADRFGPSTLANPVGVSCALVSSDGQLLMGRRNDQVAYYPGRIHPFAGCLEPRQPLDVFAEVRRELAEELSLDDSHIADLRCIGMVEDASLRQPELIFLVQSTLSLARIESRVDPQEHHASWSIPPTADAADSALREAKLLTPVGIGTLLLWGRRVFGAQWFDHAIGSL